MIIEQLTKGDCSLIAVSTEHGLSYSTVRRLWKRYKTEGNGGLKPHYERYGSRHSKSGALIYQCALWLKRHHPDWGAALIHIVLRNHYPQTPLPSERTLQPWFKAHHLSIPNKVHQLDSMWNDRAIHTNVLPKRSNK